MENHILPLTGKSYIDNIAKTGFEVNGRMSDVTVKDSHRNTKKREFIFDGQSGKTLLPRVCLDLAQ